MKINGKTQLGLAFDQHMKRDLLKIHHDKYVAHLDNVTLAWKAMDDLESLFSDSGNKNYLFRNTATELAKGIKLDKGKLENFLFLNNLPAKKATYLMGKDKFYRWHRWTEDSDIVCLIVRLEDVDPEHIKDVEEMKEFLKLPDHKIQEIIIERRNQGLITALEADVMLNGLRTQDFRALATKGIKYHVFGIDMTTGRLMYPENEKDALFEQEMMEMVRLILFTELSEIETVHLAPGQSNGTKKEGKHLNESRFPVVIVDSTWNKKLVKADVFTVSGHLRWQPCGPGMQYRKLIYIDEFEKQGYTRTINENVC